MNKEIKKLKDGNTKSKTKSDFDQMTEKMDEKKSWKEMMA